MSFFNKINDVKITAQELRFLYAENRTKSSEVDAFVKLLVAKFAAEKQPGPNVVSDETMVPFRGRLNFRQYMPGKAHVIKFGRHSIKMFIRGKPIRFGYKIWCLCGPDYIIWSHLSPTGEHTCFAGTATVNRSPHQHSSHRWLEAPARSSTKKLAATSGRRHWPICWCCPDRGPGSFDVEDATTLSWSSAAVSEWVSIHYHQQMNWLHFGQNCTRDATECLNWCQTGAAV